MFKFFKKKEPNDPKELDIISKTASLLIHTAKIDENYTNKEKLIIEKTLIELGANKENLNELIKIAEANEEKSNQMLDFTKDIKNTEYRESFRPL